MAKLIVTRDDLRPVHSRKEFDAVTASDLKRPGAFAVADEIEFVDDDKSKMLKTVEDGKNTSPDYLDRKAAPTEPYKGKAKGKGK